MPDDEFEGGKRRRIAKSSASRTVKRVHRKHEGDEFTGGRRRRHSSRMEGGRRRHHKYACEYEGGRRRHHRHEGEYEGGRKRRRVVKKHVADSFDGGRARKIAMQVRGLVKAQSSLAKSLKSLGRATARRKPLASATRRVRRGTVVKKKKTVRRTVKRTIRRR